ncbi:MAG TPA: hypothetical protein VGJ26_08830 [Pirellulales bacterium]
MADDKDELTAEVRNRVLSSRGVVETSRAECGLTTLSFQSMEYPERHAWVDTFLDDNLVVDLEDWSTIDRWDNAIGSLSTKGVSTLVRIIVAWLTGATYADCKQLGGAEVDMT